MFIVPLINLSDYRECSAKNSEGYGENYFHTPILQKIRDFPGGPVVKNLPSNAGDTSSIPGRGSKIPHAAEQLSPRATTIEPVHQRSQVQQLKPNAKKKKKKNTKPNAAK